MWWSKRIGFMCSRIAGSSSPGRITSWSTSQARSESWHGGRCCERLAVRSGDDLDQEGLAELAEVADGIDGLDPEFVDADGLRHGDLNRVIVVLLDVCRADHVAVGRDDADERVEVIGTDQVR